VTFNDRICAGQVRIGDAQELRRIAELVSPEIVLKRRLPREFGGGFLFVSPDSGLKYYRKIYAGQTPPCFKMAKSWFAREMSCGYWCECRSFQFRRADLQEAKDMCRSGPDAWL